MIPGPHIDAVAQALESLLVGIRHYYDRATGEVIMISEEFGEDSVDIDESADRYVWIAPLSYNDRFQIMEDFVETLSDETLQEELNMALIEKGAFQRFEEVLSRYPQTREQWIRFRGDKMRLHARRWLESNGI